MSRTTWNGNQKLTTGTIQPAHTHPAARVCESRGDRICVLRRAFISQTHEMTHAATSTGIVSRTERLKASRTVIGAV